MSATNRANRAIDDLQPLQSSDHRSTDPDLATSILSVSIGSGATVADRPGIGSRPRSRPVLEWRAERTPCLISQKRSYAGIGLIRVGHERENWIDF